jgi:hypothetical protein
MLAMKTTHKSTIHQAVVALIVKSGTGRIEAERQWDTIYSKEFDRAVPGTSHTWVIGEYRFEFTKVFEGRDLDPLEVISQSAQEAADLNTGSQLRGLVQALALIALIVAGFIYFL